MILTENERGEVLQSQLLLGVKGVAHYSSCRSCQEAEREVWMPRQVHGDRVVVLDEEMLQAALPEADAVITTLTGQWIGVRTADCVPVLLVDPVRRVVAAVHAGWRGTVAHIAGQTVQRMVNELGCRACDIRAAIGPSIGPEAFEVGEEVAEAFVRADRSDCVMRQLWGPNGWQPLTRPHIDLWQSNVMDLLDEGVELENIDCTPWCTHTQNDRLYSARREGIGTGRIVSAIRLEC